MCPAYFSGLWDVALCQIDDQFSLVIYYYSVSCHGRVGVGRRWIEGKYYSLSFPVCVNLSRRLMFFENPLECLII